MDNVYYSGKFISKMGRSTSCTVIKTFSNLFFDGFVTFKLNSYDLYGSSWNLGIELKLVL